jgi:enediyne biosynthesis protein E4
VQMIEAYFEPALQHTVPERQLNSLAESLPFLRGRFSSHQAFSIASVEQALGDRISAAKVLQASWLESTVFLNRGDHFEARPLPVEAQVSPAFGICVGDFNGDGNEDIFQAQNFFATQPETPRYDAGRGICLEGDGQGSFHALSGQESGIQVYGEQRGAALCDFDEDGRVDLVVTQNGTATRLYRNSGGKPGMRVRLKGAKNNLQGFGAVIRLKSGGRWGPAREIHGGGGYWSQDSAVQVLGMVQSASEIQVRWPGGTVTTSTIPGGCREITVGIDGTSATSP